MTKYRVYAYDFIPANHVESQDWFDFYTFCRFADCVHPYNQ